MPIQIPNFLVYVNSPAYVDARQALLDSFETQPPDYSGCLSPKGQQIILAAIHEATIEDINCALSWKGKKPKVGVSLHVEIADGTFMGKLPLDDEQGIIVPRERLVTLEPKHQRALITGAYSNGAMAYDSQLNAALNGTLEISVEELQNELEIIQRRYARRVEKWMDSATGNSTTSGS